MKLNDTREPMIVQSPTGRAMISRTLVGSMPSNVIVKLSTPGDKRFANNSVLNLLYSSAMAPREDPRVYIKYCCKFNH